ncbi:MAG TPA: HEAT repeat domain-containing protein, partial [Candidatus Brocadiia bacterium]|nr:HEAT repeat domain-containing protein [Candidatus Brocadiia bacterium]
MRLRAWMACAALTALLLGSSIMAQSVSFDGAQWIWFTVEPALPLGAFPEGTIYLRVTADLPQQGEIKSAEIIITCDNLFALSLNGKPVCESENPDAWGQPRRLDVSKFLAPGRNTMAIEAINTAPGPAGLIAKMTAQMADGQQVVIVSNGSWNANDTADLNWQMPNFDDRTWRKARVLGEHGMAPWGRLPVPPDSEQPGAESRAEAAEGNPDAEFQWPEAIAFIGDDCSLYRPRGGAGNSLDSLSVTIFNPRDSRAFPEHDLPAPVKVGRKLYALKPAKPGSQPQVLLDAGKGAIGSPSASFDGKRIYVSMALDDESFFHIYCLSSDGGELQRLTDGPFHDIDPAELPDGRIAFTSTRSGTFEEYHNPPSRGLFAMEPDGTGIRPLTSTFIFDNEPEVLADGRILFIRSDNFFDRGKVETLLHAIQPDGTEGCTEFGLDIGPDYGGRLRAFNCGSPAPMPDGRLAFVTGGDIVIGRNGSAAKDWRHIRVVAGDVAALPDGRLLCTTGRPNSFMRADKNKKRPRNEYSYEKIGIVDPDGGNNRVTTIYNSPGEPLHSPIYIGPRSTPPVLARKVDSRRSDDVHATGVLYCQNARFTRNTTAGWSHVRAIRVLAGKGLTTRSSHSYIVHAGSEVIELGTVPLAPDGSFAVEVPADTAIALQAVDAEGRSELNEMSWIYARPGEKRGCVGCHQPRQATPAASSPSVQALTAAPVRLVGQGRPHRFRGNNAAVTGMMELQFDRYREVAGINRHTDTRDPLATGKQEVATLILQLRDADDGMRISAAQRLAIFRDQGAAPALAECLLDENREVRVAATLALSACGARESVPPLLVALDDLDPVVAQAAAMALENLTGHLEAAFNAFAQERQSARWRDWFKSNNWELIEEELAERLGSPDRDVVRRAAVALGHIGCQAATRAALRSYLIRQRDINPFPDWRKDHQGDGARFNAGDAVNPRTLQAATRALGHMQDREAIPLLAETLGQHSNPATGNLFLAEACVEALGRIGGPEAEAALVSAFAGLRDYPEYTSWYGDHAALMACHASPVHYFIAEALDAMGSTGASNILPNLIWSVPTDFDRALLLNNDDCETVIARVIRRNDPGETVMETCLAILGDKQAKPTKAISDAMARVHGAWAGTPDIEIRAAQILSMVCYDSRHEP